MLCQRRPGEARRIRRPGERSGAGGRARGGPSGWGPGGAGRPGEVREVRRLGRCRGLSADLRPRHSMGEALASSARGRTRRGLQKGLLPRFDIVGSHRVEWTWFRSRPRPCSRLDNARTTRWGLSIPSSSRFFPPSLPSRAPPRRIRRRTRRRRPGPLLHPPGGAAVWTPAQTGHGAMVGQRGPGPGPGPPALTPRRHRACFAGACACAGPSPPRPGRRRRGSPAPRTRHRPCWAAPDPPEPPPPARRRPGRAV